MITEFKLFENDERLPRVGDYVYCQYNKFSVLVTELNKYLDISIGKIVRYEPGGDDKPYEIKFDTPPPEKFKKLFHEDYIDWTKTNVIYPYCRWFREKDIVIFSPNKEDIEIFMNSNKFGI